MCHALHAVNRRASSFRKEGGYLLYLYFCFGRKKSEDLFEESVVYTVEIIIYGTGKTKTFLQLSAVPFVGGGRDIN